MSILDDIKDTVMGWINYALYKAKTYAYGLYESVWNYASQISDDLWRETRYIWDRIGEIPVLTYETIRTWVKPWINDVKEYLLDLIDDLEDWLEYLIDELEEDFDWLRYLYDNLKEEVDDVITWISHADDWFIDKFNTMKDTVITWVAEGFESILDRVFEEED